MELSLDLDRLKPKIANIGNAILQLQQGLRSLEVMTLKAGFAEQERAIRLELCGIIGMVNGAEFYNDLPDEMKILTKLSTDTDTE